MDWNLIQQLFAGQGLVFWGAITAVALGLTLLSVSIVFQVRRMVGDRRPGLPLPGLRRGARACASGITLTETGYAAAPAPVASRPEPATAPAEAPDGPLPAGPDLREMRDRLRAAADRLDAIHSSLRPRRAATARAADSPLKAGPGGVDYVYKTGQA